MPPWTNDPDAPDRHLIVISAPRRRHPKYWRHFEAIIDFDIRLTQAIIGHDNVIVLASKAEMPFLRGKLPDDVLLEANLKDIWIRDFAPILTTKMVQFVYRPSYLKPWEAAQASDSFASFCRRYGLKFERSKLVLDGGNLVSNHKDMAVVTERVLSDNPDWTQEEILAELKVKLALDHVAIIPEELKEATGHADGLIVWLNERTVASSAPAATSSETREALDSAIPAIQVLPLPRSERQRDHRPRTSIQSAWGIYANATVTNGNAYVPAFDDGLDAEALAIFNKACIGTVSAVNEATVATLGGGIRCLTWQVTGPAAPQLITTTRAASPGARNAQSAELSPERT
jgi:agmatine/peptidylarginine deiminase